MPKEAEAGIVINDLLRRSGWRFLDERAIPTQWLERALDAPERSEADKDDPQLVHHLVVIPEHGHRVLRVVFNHLVAPVRVVTVYFDRKMKGKL